MARRTTRRPPQRPAAPLEPDTHRLEHSASITVRLDTNDSSLHRIFHTILDRLLSRDVAPPDSSPPAAAPAGRAVSSLLTPREREIAALLAAGNTNEQIAAALVVSVHTVRSHRKRIYTKLDIHSVAELRARRDQYEEGSQ